MCSFIVWIASVTESSAPIVTGLPCENSDAFVESGSLPSAIAFTTMSRSVSMPLRRSSSPQIGSAPTPRSAIFFAATASDSFSPMHSAPWLITSRAVFAISSSFA